ncbi:MAG: hypothetical protein CG439_2738, partial [Methylococcaceae bacterium NSP1-2]
LVLELLLLDELHPRSLAYQLCQLSAHIGALPRTKGKRYLSEEERLILKAYTNLRLCKVLELTQVNENEGIYTNLEQLLANTANLLWRLADVIAEAYFSHSQTSQLIIAHAPEDEL